MSTFNDYFDEDTVTKATAIMGSESYSFAYLVKLSGLDPRTDFRFSDLQGVDFRDENLAGFDFTGADLRGCLKNSKTYIDETTLLDQAEIDWVEIERRTIVSVMQEIEAATNSAARVRALQVLTEEFQSPGHIATYLRSAIRASKSYDAIFDFVDYFQSADPADNELITLMLRGFLLQRSKRRNYNHNSQISPIRITTILSRIRESNNSILIAIFLEYQERRLALKKLKSRPNYNLDELEISDILATMHPMN